MTTQTTRRGKTLAAALLLVVACASAFELPKEAVYPRIFSPNGDGINDMVYFDVVNPLLDGLEGRIYDNEGAPVGHIRFDSYPGGNVERWAWDGRDENGNTVRAGIYIYEVKNGDDAKTGTVVVAQ